MRTRIVLMGLPLALAALSLFAMSAFAPQQARANPKIAKDTGKACPVCHTAPPALNDRGKKFKATGKL